MAVILQDSCNFILLLRHLYTNMQRCFRYAGCIGSFWQATKGLLQGDPLSVVILNCVLCPLLRQLSLIPGLSIYAFADDLTVVSSSWDTLHQAYLSLTHFCNCTDLVLNTSKCQLWNKGSPSGDYPASFDQLCYRFYPFLLGSPIDIGIPYVDAIQQHGDITVSRARKISKLPLPYRVTYRLFVSLVSKPTRWNKRISSGYLLRTADQCEQSQKICLHVSSVIWQKVQVGLSTR